jgi:hypothetical protein
MNFELKKLKVERLILNVEILHSSFFTLQLIYNF